MKNPFNYLQFATGDNFYDRKEVFNDLRSRIMSGNTNIVLYGPRRYGKSSLVAQLVMELEKKGIPCVTFDVMKVPSIDLFVSSYATKVYRKFAPVKFELRKIGEFLKSLRLKLTIGSDGETGISVDTAESKISSEELTEILDLPQKILPKGKRAVIVMDEFQEVSELLPNDQFERVMRSVIQSHENISYIFLGSRYHMLRRMFTERNRPFYRSAIAMMLDKPPFEESVDFVVSRFCSCSVAISREVAAWLVVKVDNIPYYIQQLGFEVFRLVDDAGRHEVLQDDVVKAYRLLSGFNRDQYEQQMVTFSSAQKKLLAALAQERTCEFTDSYRVRYRLGVSSTVNSTKRKLMENGYVEISEGKYCVADPFFAEYLKMDLMG
jgi:AAA+ ATPase superfamily predicted ATPase